MQKMVSIKDNLSRLQALLNSSCLNEKIIDEFGLKSLLCIANDVHAKKLPLGVYKNTSNEILMKFKKLVKDASEVLSHLQEAHEKILDIDQQTEKLFDLDLIYDTPEEYHITNEYCDSPIVKEVALRLVQYYADIEKVRIIHALYYPPMDNFRGFHQAVLYLQKYLKQTDTMPKLRDTITNQKRFAEWLYNIKMFTDKLIFHCSTDLLNLRITQETLNKWLNKEQTRMNKFLLDMLTLYRSFESNTI
jgi:hypothetical protein